MTMERHSSLYLSMPMASTSSLPLMPARCELRRRRAVRQSARTQRLVDLVLHRQAVAVPPKTALNVVARGGGVAGYNVLREREFEARRLRAQLQRARLDGARQDVAVVRQAGRERRAVVEDKPGARR